MSEDIEAMRYNTAISALMILLTANTRSQMPKFGSKFCANIVSFCPHISEELWENRPSESIAINIGLSGRTMVVDNEIMYPIQINGKVRAEYLFQLSDDGQAIMLGKLKPRKFRLFRR